MTARMNKWPDVERLKRIFLKLLFAGILLLLIHCLVAIQTQTRSVDTVIRMNKIDLGPDKPDFNDLEPDKPDGNKQSLVFYGRRGLHDLRRFHNRNYHRQEMKILRTDASLLTGPAVRRIDTGRQLPLSAPPMVANIVSDQAPMVANIVSDQPTSIDDGDGGDESVMATTQIPRDHGSPINDSYFKVRDHVVNEMIFQYPLEPYDVCPRTNVTFLVIIVCSKHEHFPYRRAIRDTWGSIRLYQKRIKLVFLLGEHADDYWNNNIMKESETFRDILQTNTHETYTNLALKVLAGLQWTSNHCSEAYVLKSDEDMIVNIHLLMDVLLKRPLNNSVLGSENRNAPVMRTSKWRVDYSVYPYSTYPPYLSGNTYVVTSDAARKLVTAFRYMPLINVEDAYITGILARVADVQHSVDHRFTYWGTPAINPCDIVNNKMISGTHMTPTLLYRMWSAINKRNC